MIRRARWPVEGRVKEAPTTAGRRPLHFAARNGREGVVDYLLTSAGVKPDPQAYWGVTPLQLAVWRHEEIVARRLVASGADLLQINGCGCGLSHWFAMGPDNLRLGNWLLEMCGEHLFTNMPNYRGHTPLHKAAFAGNRRICEWLIHLGANAANRDNAGKTAADEAAAAGHDALALWLGRNFQVVSDVSPGRSRALLATILRLVNSPPSDGPLPLLRGRILLCILDHGDKGIEISHLPKKYLRLWGERLDVSDRSSLGLPRGGGLMRVLAHPAFSAALRISLHSESRGPPRVVVRKWLVDQLSHPGYSSEGRN